MTTPTVDEVTEALASQLNYFTTRLNGGKVSPKDLEDIPLENNQYYMSNNDVASSVNVFNNTMDGTN